MWAVHSYAIALRAEATVIDLRKNLGQEINAIGWIKRLNLLNSN